MKSSLIIKGHRYYSPKYDEYVVAVKRGSVYSIFRRTNGDVKTLEQAKEHLRHVDGVMMGRAVYANPWMLASADREIFGKENAVPASRKVLP